MSNLVIMESPAKAATVKGYLGSNYKVMATVGHFRDLPVSTIGVDIENGYTPKYITIRGKGEIIKTLKSEAKKADKVFIATDPDREGEAIAWHVTNVLGIKPEDAKRVTFNEITKNTVKANIKQPRAIDLNLVNSQQARRILDRIVGYKLSPFFWQKIQNGISAGRVQSVAVRIIIDRENEIKAFVPREYWTIECNLEKKDGRNVVFRFEGDKNGKLELDNEEQANRVVNAIENGEFTVNSVKHATKLKNPLPPFTTSTLQQEAIRKLGFRSAQVMKVAQMLYEGINVGAELGGTQGLITYMRTDSMRISEEAQNNARNYISSKLGTNYIPEKPRVYKAKSNAQDAHEAIRPSNMNLEPDKIKKSLTNEQYKLYKLIWNRFLASQMSSAELDTISADAECSGYVFRVTGSTVKFPGYLSVWDDTDNGSDNVNKTALPELTEGEKLKNIATQPKQHFTEPPSRFNEATLVKLFEEKGIGRPSTYSTIISTIISRKYVVREGKLLKPTELGELTNSVIMQYFPEIVDVAFTAKMEDNLDNIEQGQSNIADLLDPFYKKLAQELENAQESCPVYKKAIEIAGDLVCPHCGEKLIVKGGRYGSFAACPNYPDCNYTVSLDKDGNPKVKEQVTDKICPLCSSPLAIRSSRFGKFYGCTNYPKCKYTKQIDGMIEVKCPKCGGDLFRRKNKKGIFYICENNYETNTVNKCDYITWDRPLNEKCPKCGGQIYLKLLKGKQYKYCANEGCGFREDTIAPVPNKDKSSEDEEN